MFSLARPTTKHTPRPYINERGLLEIQQHYLHFSVFQMMIFQFYFKFLHTDMCNVFVCMIFDFIETTYSFLFFFVYFGAELGIRRRCRCRRGRRRRRRCATRMNGGKYVYSERNGK